MPEYQVKIDQLRVGVFIRLDLKWFAHPFLSNSFKITRLSILDTLRELGLEKVTCIPEKSDVLPLPPSREPAPPPSFESDQPTPEIKQLWEAKRIRLEQLKKRRENMARCERQFEKGITTLRHVMQNIDTGTPESVEEAGELLSTLIDSLTADRETAVQLMNTELGNKNAFYHSLNVAILSMILGLEAGMAPFVVKMLGLGALFHDAGKTRIPKNITTKTGPLTPAETTFLQLHPTYGKEIVTKVVNFPTGAVDIVHHHHERLDGKGYPDRLSGKEITTMTRIAAITNTYDNYCNRANPKDSLTPYEALSRMFAQERAAFDNELLAFFIQCLGIYPPGTIVRLNDGHVGIVISVTRNNPLKPSVVIYDPGVPKEEALILDLREDPDLAIERSIRPFTLEQEVFDYLSPRTRITYYVSDSESVIPALKPR